MCLPRGHLEKEGFLRDRVVVEEDITTLATLIEEPWLVVDQSYVDDAIVPIIGHFEKKTHLLLV